MTTQHRAGRHRWGTPGLQHCRAMPTVQARLTAGGHTRHAMLVPRSRLRPALAIGFGAAVAALVSGWFTAGEALAAQLHH